MPKKKDKSEVEYYRGKLREAQKEINALRKQVKSLGKKEHMFDDALQDYQELLDQQEAIELPKEATCMKCHTGKIQLIISMDKKDIYQCTHCDNRKVINK